MSAVYGHKNVVEFRTHQLKPFKQLFDSIKNKLPDTSFLFTKTGLKIAQYDAATTFLVDVRLDADNFEHYYFDESSGKTVHDINLSAAHLNQVFKCVTKDDTIFAFWFTENPTEVTVMFENDKKNETRKFEIPVQNPDEDIQLGQIDNLEGYEYSLSMPSADLNRICKELKTMECEKVQILHDRSSLYFKSNPRKNSTSTVKTTIVRKGSIGGEETTTKFDKVPEREGSIYSDTFKFSTLYEFSKSQSGGDNKIVRIYLKNNEPLILHYEIGTLGEMHVALATYADLN